MRAYWPPVNTVFYFPKGSDNFEWWSIILDSESLELMHNEENEVTVEKHTLKPDLYKKDRPAKIEFLHLLITTLFNASGVYIYPH